jgi:hypothetical protein
LPASRTKAVLQDWAKTSENGTVPSSPPSKLRKRRPSTVVDDGQSTWSVGVRPAASSAAVVTTLKVEPGG